MDAERPARAHIYTLDILRFCAAFAVMLFHLCFYDWASRDAVVAQVFADAARYEALAPFTWFGWVGVEVFFVISGFVIANSANGSAPSAFLKGRLLRLYPAVWVCATLTLLAWIFLAARPFGDVLDPYLRGMTLWLKGPWIDGAYWSLAVEIVFYGLVFWALVARRAVSLTSLPWLLTALSLAHYAIRYVPAVSGTLPEGLVNWLWPHMELLLMRHGAFFAIGIWLWLASRREMTLLRFAGLAVAMVAGAVEVLLRASEIAGGEVDYGGALPAWAPLSAWLAALGTIVAAARAPHWFEVRTPALQAALKRIGLMTYPLFLAHAVIGAGLMRTMIHGGVPPWVALVVAIVAMLTLAYVVCATAEVALRRLLRGGLDRAEVALKRVAPAWLFIGGKDLALR